MNELMKFDYERQDIRIKKQGNEVWFCLKDICSILGIGNTTDTANRLDSDEVTTFDSIEGLRRDTAFVNESGLYTVLLRSDKPQAKPFRKWVTSEVLPSIRKTGQYGLTQRRLSRVEMAEMLLDSEKRNEQKDKVIKELEPRAVYTDRVLKSEGLVNTNQIAKDFGMSATTLNRILCKLGVQYKQGGQWLLYSRYQNCGYVQSETISIPLSDDREKAVMNTKWTQVGRRFICELLKKHGYLLQTEMVLQKK